MNEGERDRQLRALETITHLIEERIENAERHFNERMDAARIRDSEILAEIREDLKVIKHYQREQNGNVSLALDRIAKLEQQQRSLDDEQTAHDLWHGKNDEGIDARIKVFEKERNEAAIRKAVYQSQWKLITSSMGIGGSVVAALLYVLGAI